MEDFDKLQKWSKEIVKFVPVKSQFTLYGNIYDVYPLYINSRYIPLPIKNFLGKLLTRYETYKLVIIYEPLFGFHILEGIEEIFSNITGLSTAETKKISLTKAYEVIEKLVDNTAVYTSVIINFSSRLNDIAERDLQEFLYKMFRLSINTNPKLIDDGHSKYNPVIYLLDKENDLPAWYTLENPRIKSIAIPKPDSEIREKVARSLLYRIDGFIELSDEKQREVINNFVDQTNGMYATEIVSIVRIATKEKLDIHNLNEAIRLYKIGITENPWSKIRKDKLLNAEKLIKRRVKGQDLAVRKAVSILKRAFFNLSGSQYSRISNRPKGVLFLAGPTGVGKTELAKAITELLFGSETSYIRFDMSEFSHEHSDQRLIGAPPGYVGYDVGGELTNAIKQNPFSVVLFDEIEKAHPKILDIFLQILDDGRLTSGRGETVYFSEAFIIFTSNLGIYEMLPDGRKIQRVNPEMPYPEVSKKVIEAIEDFFKFKISRPEILNRIGENIIVFDFIRPDVAKEIFEKMLSNVLLKLKEVHKITVNLEDQVRNTVKEESCKDLSMGGRGIGNKLEEVFINPLSELLFELMPPKNSVVIIDNIYKENNVWKLKGKVHSIK